MEKDKANKNLRELSKKHVFSEVSTPTINEIIAGSFQRLADAAEKTAFSFTELKDRIDYYQKLIEEKNQEIQDLKNSNRTLRGHVTRAINKTKNENDTQP